jgi:hypothetical protein
MLKETKCSEGAFLVVLTLHHPAARQFCRSTYTITDNINSIHFQYTQLNLVILVTFVV